MTKRLAMTPAVGLFAGLSVVSYSAVSMLLTGVHGTPQATTNATNACSPSAANSPASTAANSPASTARAARIMPTTRTASQVRARSQHPAGMPVLLADAVRLGSAQTTPLPSTQPSPSASAPALPQPSPGSSAAPSTALPEPAPVHSTSSKPLTPGGTLKSPTPTATPTTTTSPTTSPTPTHTPTPTTSPTPKPATLCLKIQTLNNVSSVDPHATVRYAIWIWLSSGTNGTAKITLSAAPSFVSPTFTVCVPSGRSDCKIGGLSGHHAQVQAKLKAPGPSHHHVTLTATATSADASNSASASVSVAIKQKSSSGGSSSSNTQNAGDGGTLPPATDLPTGTVPGLGIQPSGNLGSAFPQVSPSPAASGAAAGSHGHSTKAIDLSAGLPLDVRLIGGQVIGLAVLAAAITIAVARLSLRRQPQPPGKDGPAGS